MQRGTELGDTKHRGTQTAGTLTMPGHRIPLPAALWEQSSSRARQGVTTPVTVTGGSSALRGPLCRAALSQAVSPDPLNHWKIRQGSGTGNSWAPGGHPAPLGLPGSTGKWGRMWESQPGLSCSRVVAQGQQGPHEEPKWQEMLSAHLSPRSGEVRRALWCHRMHLHPGNRLGSPHVGRRRR